ncbi:MAG: bifunctional DNA-binding transcriptional regulator/O6-methylguanine-DNA methyltransferase Ada [Candidatus Obscuribacter sp.]|nr:bifunctional DNA-binding transcriptional regulator/O6-methylguanine-DNA methyltransferase Ada [Candidatus Obscuribacter sp.]
MSKINPTKAPNQRQLDETASTVASSDKRWEALTRRDKSCDGQFYYSVKTTGVYCRPSCGARLPLPANIAFYDTQDEAVAAGFRPCKRCKPDKQSLAQQHTATISDACQLIATSAQAAATIPSLDELASHAGLSTYHFHRLFKSITGLTPKAYGQAQRAQIMRDKLNEADTVTTAIYDAGYNSAGRFYTESDNVLGMKPSDYKAGGANTEIRFAIAQCSLGALLVAKSERGICSILLGDDAHELACDLQDRFPHANIIGDDESFAEIVAQVVGFVEAPAIGLDLPLDVRGTAFQQRVWQALREIPPGTTVSYTDVANKIGSPQSVRAVATACAANAIAIAIPCHRVVRSDGSISGYRWGVERKRELLKRESSTTP